MKTDFLKNLGITEQATIDAIMAENGRDVNAAKTEVSTLRNRISELEETVSDKDKEINSLNTKVGDTTALNEKISQLESDKIELSNQLNDKVSKIQKAHAIENGVRDAKARNVKAVMALLDMEKITYKDDNLEGLSEQLDQLISGEDTSFLFGSGGQTPPSGTTPSNPPADGGNNPPTSNNLASAIAKALTSN